jgi:hypothetical protein
MMKIQPPRRPEGRRESPVPRRSGWQILGTALACVVAAFGLLALAVAIFFSVAISQYGSSK